MNRKDLALNNESHPSPTTDSNQKNKFRSVVDAEPADLMDSFDLFDRLEGNSRLDKYSYRSDNCSHFYGWIITFTS